MNVFDAPPRSPRFDALPPPSPGQAAPLLAAPVAVLAAPPSARASSSTGSMRVTAGPSGKTRAVATAGPSTTFAPYIPKPTAPPPIPGGGVRKPNPGLPFATLVEKSAAEAPMFVASSKGKKKGRTKARGGTGARKVLLLLLLVAMVGGGVFAYQKYMPQDPPHPDAWDPQVAPLADFVERERGLTFEHPVFVDLLSDADYASVTAAAAADGDHTTSATDRAELLNAFGLGNGGDLAATDDRLDHARSIARYLPDTDRIAVRASAIADPATRLVLVHELTHALQAQRFTPVTTGPHALAQHAIAEADARRIAQAYRVGLTGDEEAQVATVLGADPEFTALTEGLERAAAIHEVPLPLLDLSAATHQLGARLVLGAIARSGNAGVDDLLNHPPADRTLLSPWTIDSPDAGPMELPLPEGAISVVDRTDLTMLDMLVVLDAWLPYTVARGAVDLWVRGDYVAFRRTAGGPLCVDVGIQLAGGADAMGAALAFWAAASGSAATPVVDGNNIRFETCSRGPAATVPPPAVVGTATAVAFEQASVPTDAATDLHSALPYVCTARAMVDNPDLAPLIAKAVRTPAEQAVLEQARAAMTPACTH